MGSGTSMEGRPPSQGPSHPPPSGRSRSASARGYSARQTSMRSERGRPQSALSRTSSRRSTRSASWREAVKSGSLKRSDSRKERAAALGRKSACVVQISKTGFSYQHIQLCEGQVVTFEWYTDSGNGFNVTQVMHDGEQYRPVTGGFNSGPVKREGFYEQQFNLEGEYKFVSAGIRCTPLTIEVYRRKHIECALSDSGFVPRVVRLDEGNSVQWNWTDNNVPRCVTEMKYSHKLGAVVPKTSDARLVPTKSGVYKRDFNKPGLYYFQSEGSHPGETFSTVVHVRERQHEYKIEVLDRAFNPPIVVVEEGDRVWWEWNKEKCTKPHCIYQVEPPPLDHPVDESFKPIRNGFKWPSPSPSGLLSHEFFTPGVYYFSDHNLQEAAEYLGTVIVKPKQNEHFVEINPDGFTPDLLYLRTGDRLWWTWASDEVDSVFNIVEVEKCISPLGGRPAIEPPDDSEGGYMDEDLEHIKVETGLDTVQPANIGVYHYRVSNQAAVLSTCSVVVQGGHRNHTIHVTDQGFEPKVVTIYPGDRIWWIWQDGTKQHNIIQVSHQGVHIEGGFSSGAALDCPSAFMHQFIRPGVFYYVSNAIAKSFGAVVVASQPQVHEVQVTANSIVRDPCIVKVNDVVAWTYRGLRQHDVEQGDTLQQLTTAQHNSNAIVARRCLNRLFTERGVYHFASKAFLRQNRRDSDDEETRVSTVIVDDALDSATVRVDSKGFHPNSITVRKGQSVLWTWKESGEEAHNIINVNPPNSEAPLSVIQGGRSFNSGKPVAKNSFLYTFDDSGEFCVASQGAPGHAGIITVLDKAIKTGTPYITSAVKQGFVEKNHVIHLTCDTDRAQIYYTIDGSVPELHKLSSKVYDTTRGIQLKSPGIFVIRAVAVREHQLASELLTSQRFYVDASAYHEAESTEEEEEEVEDEDKKKAMWHWWNCVPSIKAVVTGPGVMEVFWEHPQVESRSYIKGYNLFLNGVTYCGMFPPSYNSVSVTGLAGDRVYEIYLEVYPNDPMYLPHKSNKLKQKISKTHTTGGPLVSLETTEKPDTLAIVWMAIDSDHSPIEGYRVYLNGQLCGNQVVPDANSDRCKVVIEGCQTDYVYKILVAAVPKDGGSPKMSNEVVVTLPLDSDQITLPPLESRLDDDDLYKEHIEIREGTGDPEKRKKKKSPKTAVVEVQPDSHKVEEKPITPKEEVEVQVTPMIGAFDGDDKLPAPVVSVESLGGEDVKVSWHFQRSAEPVYKLDHAEVSVVGRKFKPSVNSDLSYESMQQQLDDGSVVNAIQHRWNITHTNAIKVTGLCAGLDYQVQVIAHYSLVNANQPYEIQAKSAVITYTTLGPPHAPTLKVLNSDMYQVTLGWEPGAMHRDMNLSGFRVLVDGEQLGPILSANTRQSVIDNLSQGKMVKVQVQSLTSSSMGDSEPSNTILVYCPPKPPAPSISQQPSYKKGTVTVAWERPQGFEHANYGEDIYFYRIYLDGVWHGEVKACAHCNRNGYQYLLNDLQAGQTYDVTVKAFAGQQKVDSMSESVYCICDSDMSHGISVMCPAPPRSPHLRLEGMHSEGIDVTWEMPQQFGDAQVSGYQMMKNGKLYGSIIPADVHSLHIRGLSLGEKITLQLLALTDHPVGRGMELEDSHLGDIPKEIFNGERYSACTPGPKLSLVYTGLVQAPAKVWCEQVTGHSAMIVWQSEKRARPHYVFPDNYQVTWWPGDKPDQDINSQQTKEDHLLITGLKPRTTYNVAVEARKAQKYTDLQDQPDDHYSGTFILSEQTEKISFSTASPPGAPTNIGILATTCNSIQVGWDPPRERGAEVTGIRVDAVAVKSTEHERHACVEVMADATSAVIPGLAEKTEYLISVTAITEEYFDQLPPGNEMRRSRQLPKNKAAPDDAWLPSVTMLATTSAFETDSGTIPPTDLRIVKTSVNSVTLTWKPASVFGSNRLQGTIVRWAEGKFSKSKEDSQLAHHRSVEADTNKVTLDCLHPGILYKVVVEAVVSVKTTLKSQVKDPEGEKMNRRTTHVMSRPLFVRTRAPCEPPKPIVTGYTQNSIQLYWEKPLLYSVIGKDDNGNPKYLKYSLEGYRLEINGKPHMRLASNAQSCTLVKCKGGKRYKIVLVALTCTEEVKKERRRRAKGGMNASLTSDTLSQSTVGQSTKDSNMAWETTAEDLENDESPSKPVDVTLPRSHDGLHKEVSVAYDLPSAGLFTGGGGDSSNRSKKGEEEDLGDLKVEWSVQGDDSLVKQWNLSWHCHADGAVQRKIVDSQVRTCLIPVQHRRCLYDVTVEAEYYKSVSVGDIQIVQCLIPGTSDAPVIWTRSVTNNEFVIEWAEPRLYGVKIKGYQVHMNGKKVGNMLNSHHRKAVIPCKPRRQYKVNLVAIPNDVMYENSEISNTLLVHTGGESIQPSAQDMTDENVSRPITPYEGDSDDLPVRVIKVTESSIHLDWSNYTEVEGMHHYRVVWSSAAQPAEKEVKLPAGERSCVIHKCYPGTNHFISVYACALDDRILDKSRQIRAQTSAAPDTPAVHVRACNFKYIAIQWEQPRHYGDAAVTGYKVYVNGVVEAVLGPEQFTYTFTQGKWCKEYSFQVQAQTTHEQLYSKPSDPLVVCWPGVQSPTLMKAPSVSANSIRIMWDTPDNTEGVKIKQYKMVCLDEDTQRIVQVVSPIHAESNEAELQNLKHGSYIVYLEVHLHGTTDVVKSDILKIKPAITPDPPHITVSVVGLEERRQIEKVTCSLINKRDRLLNILSNAESKSRSPSPRRNQDEDQVMAKAAESLAQVEEKLDDCMSALNHYTGHLLAHVSWTCTQSNPDVRVTGYKVLVDGKQYGTTLHAGVKNIRIKLGLNQASHRLSMVSVCDRPQTTSHESNAVELLTEPFLPFTYFSFLSQDPKSRGPGPSYQEALALERKQQKGQKPLSQGLIKKKVAPPGCTLLDIFQGVYHPLFPPSGPRKPTAILFWAKWCYSSRKTLGWFVKYATRHSSQFEFVAVSCTPASLSPTDRQELVQVISENGWREDTCIRHVTSRSANEITLKPYEQCYWKHAHEVVKSTDVCEIFGVQGVPTIIIVHPEDYIAWKGRYCAFDYPAFEHFMGYIFAQSLKNPNLPDPDPWDIHIDMEAFEGSSRPRLGDSSHLIHRPSSALHRQSSTTSTTLHMNGSARPQSGKKNLFTKNNQHPLMRSGSKDEKKITVDMRPFSASQTYKSPYTQKLTPAGPTTKRGKSAKKAKSTY